MKDMNISTSFLSDAEDPESDDTSENSNVEVSNTVILASSPEIVPHQKITEPLVTEKKDSRQCVLELVGKMLDSKLLNEPEAGQAVCLAMRNDNTHELMATLLRARSSIQAQSVFLKMWLAGFREEKHKVTVLQRFPTEAVNPSPPLMPLSLHFSDASPLESPIAKIDRTPSILLSDPIRHFKKFSSSTVSTESPSPKLVLANMMGRLESTSSDDCGV